MSNETNMTDRINKLREKVDEYIFKHTCGKERKEEIKELIEEIDSSDSYNEIPLELRNTVDNLLETARVIIEEE